MSEIAKLRQQIDQEIIAMKHVMHGYATVARHDIITHHFANLEIVYERLAAEIGNAAAIQAISEKLEEVPLSGKSMPGEHGTAISRASRIGT